MLSRDQIIPGSKVRCVYKANIFLNKHIQVGKTYTVRSVAPAFCALCVEEVSFNVPQGSRMYPYFTFGMFDLVNHSSQNSTDAWDRAMRGI